MDAYYVYLSYKVNLTQGSLRGIDSYGYQLKILAILGPAVNFSSLQLKDGIFSVNLFYD